MDFNKIKQGFKLYLAELNESKGKSIKEDLQLNDTASIFLHSKEFRNYLSTEYQVDSSVMSKSINDILKMDVVNGKLVDVDEMEDALDFENGEFDISGSDKTNNDTAPEQAAADENSVTQEPGAVEGDGEAAAALPLPEESQEKTSGSMADLINEFFEDSDINSVVDADGDGKLSDEEIHNFLGAAATLDGDEKNLSIEDLFSAAELIKEEGITDIVEDDENDIAVETGEKSVTDNTSDNIDDAATNAVTGSNGASSTGSTGGSSGGGYSGGGSVGGSSGGSYSPTNSAPVEKTLDNMNLEELKSELSTREKDLSDKQKELSEATSGESKELQDKQDKIDEAYEKYQEEVEKADKDLAEELDDKKTEIDDKKQEISDKEAEITENECKVTEAETAVSNSEATISSINNAISSVNDAMSGDISDEQKSSYNEKLSSLKEQLSEAEKAKEEAENSLKDAKEALKTSKEQKTKLEDDLDDLNTDMEDIEEKILEKEPKIKEYMDDYKKAQEDFDTAKADAISKAQEAVEVAQKAVTEVQNKINEAENKAIEASVGEYNEEAGKKLAQNALNVDGTTGLCLGGVSKTLAATYGEGLPGLGSAYKAAEALRGNTPGYEGIASHFVEKTDYTVDDLPNLPAGAIIVWENNGPGGLSQEHGHISISLGDGRESSDHIQKQIQCPRNFTVFLPIS